MSSCTRLSFLGLVAPAAFVLACGCGRDGEGGGPSLPIVSITAPDPAATEGAADTGSLEISRTGDTSAELVVHFSIGGAPGVDAATNGVDYNDQATAAALETSATIGAGSASVIIVIEVIDDSDVESTEGLMLTLSPAAEYVVAASPGNWATVYIADDEPPQSVSISALDPDADEKGSDPGTFRITRSGDTTSALNVNFQIATGTGQATNGTDYNDQATGSPLGTSATIPADSALVDIVVVPVDDTDQEPTEAVSLTLLDDVAYSVAAFPDDTATVQIADDDTPPEVSIVATDAAAAEEGPDSGTFEILRVGRVDSALVVYFDIAAGAGEATNGTDYNDQATGNPLGTNVTIPYGLPSTTITIVPVDDDELEGPETATLTLVADAAYSIASAPDNTATVVVADNDVPPLEGPFDYGPEIVTEYSWDGSDYVESALRTYSYDAGGKMTTILEQSWTGVSWEDSLLTTYTYNGDDTVDTITVESWNGMTWNVDSTTTCGYAGGRMTTHVVDDATEGTITSTTFIYTGSLVTQEDAEESTDGGTTWSPTGITTYTYDGQDRLSSGVIDAYDSLFGWMEVGDLGIAYDGSGRLDTETIDLDFMGFFQSTVVMGPTTYDATGRLQTMEMTVDVVVMGEPSEHDESLAECYYDGMGRLEEVVQYEWDDGLTDWVLIGKTTFTNTDAGSSHTFEHENATPVAMWPVELYGCGDINPHLWP